MRRYSVKVPDGKIEKVQADFMIIDAGILKFYQRVEACDPDHIVRAYAHGTWEQVATMPKRSTER